VPNTWDLSPLIRKLQTYIDDQILSGISFVIYKDGQRVGGEELGYADMASGRKMASDTIFRIFSNSKIITTAAAMCCHDEGHFQLDDPLEAYIPSFANLKVLRSNQASSLETEPLRHKPTVRQLLSHSAGFSYGFLMESPVDELYNKARLLDPHSNLAQMVDKLSELPLAYQPGTGFQYSISTDILSRLIEIWSGSRFSEFLQSRIFEPLAMKDTGFYVPENQKHRLSTNYIPINMSDPMAPGLKVMDDSLMGGYLAPRSLESGGGGLVSTLGDYATFFRMLEGLGQIDGQRILSDSAVREMTRNQLPQHVYYKSNTWPMPDTVFGLGVAIKTAPQQGEPEEAINEYHWGGIAGTHSWTAPKAGLTALVFTQRHFGYCHPFSYDFKRMVYEALANH